MLRARRKTPPPAGHNDAVGLIWRHLAPAVAAFAACLAPAGMAQGAWTVQTVVPDVITVASAGTVIGFAPGAGADESGFQDAPPDCLGQLATTYPPAAFPACYRARVPSNGTLSAQVFANAGGLWTLQLEIPDLTDSATGATIVADQVYYRANGGPWSRGATVGQTVLEGSGPTNGYLDLQIDFVLLLHGTEHSGSYLANALLTGFLAP